MVKYLNLGVVVLPVVMFLSHPASAQDRDSPVDAPPVLLLGPLEVHPSLALTETWRDNIKATANDRLGDFVTSLRPAVSLKLPVRAHQFTLDADVDFDGYAKHSAENKTTYQVGALGQIAIGNLVSVKVGDTYSRKYEPYLESPAGISEWYDTNAAAVSVKYSLAEVSKVQLDYTLTSLRYQQSDFRSDDEGLLAAYLYYRVLPNTLAFVEYDYKTADYVDGGSPLDSTGHSGLLGAEFEISSYAKGVAKAGFLTKNFQDPEMKDYSTWVASVDLTAAPTDATRLRLTAKRDLLETKTLNTRYYISTGIAGEFRVKFLDRLEGAAKASYSRDEYSNAAPGQDAARKDDIISAGLGVKYRFNAWLSFDADYRLRTKNSNLDASVTENAVALKVTAAL